MAEDLRGGFGKASRWSRWLFYPPEGSTFGAAARGESLNFAVALGLIALFVYLPFTQLTTGWNWSGVYRYREKFYQGFLLTILLSLASLVLSTLFGLLSALAGRSRFLPLRYANRIYIDLVRGTPLLVQILILYYVTANALGINDRNVCGVLILSFSYAAYISEVIRAGIESVGKASWNPRRPVRADDGADVPPRHLPASLASNDALAGGAAGVADQG